ncbi:MAG: NAD-dependent epimerase/dehydratase family protein [Candidatus Kryptoniota bacterium]
MNYYTILGGGGVVANQLAKLLLSKNRVVRMVSRSGYRIDGTISVKADATILNQLIAAVKDSSVVYLCVGLKYDHSVWALQWPSILSNTIEACKRTGSRLVFLDNVYSYGKVDGIMTELTPYNPCSKKGEIRAKLATKFMEEVKGGSVVGLIARSADFYGPYADKTGIPNIMVFRPFSQGKKASWLVNDQTKHSFTFTLDIADALYTLSESHQAYGQIWHLPTAPNPLTGKEFIELAARELGVPARYRVLHKWTLRLAGLFDKTVSELYEMLYQNEVNYIFDSSKFQKTFQVTPTSYKSGIIRTAQYYKVLKTF